MPTKISELPASTGLVLTDIFPVVDDPGGIPVTQRAAFTQLQTLLSEEYVLKAGDTMTGSLNMTAGQSYQYNGKKVIQANTPLGNYFFGPCGNLTMTGASNVAAGDDCLTHSTTGNANAAFGVTSLRDITTGHQNTGIGEAAIRNITTGFWNTSVGYNTGIGIITGHGNTIIGANVFGLAANLTNNIIISDGSGNRRINVIDTGFVGIPTLTPNSGVHISTSFSLPYVEKDSTYTIGASDYAINCVTNTFTVTLPTAVGIVGRIYVLKNSGFGTITIDPAGAELINGLASASLASGASTTIQSTGTGWMGIGDPLS